MPSNEDVTMPTITLGWELEAIRRARRNVSGIEVGHDGSVHGEQLEYRIKRDHVFAPLKSLSVLRTLTSDPYLEVDTSCGFHVHLGLARRSRKIHTWAGWFITLARELEEDAFACVPESRRTNRFCQSWKRHPGTIIAKQYSPSKGDNRERYNWVNPVEIFRPGGIRTVEIRLMGESKRYSHLASWIACCRLMGMASWRLISDPSCLEYEKSRLRQYFRLMRDTFMGPRAMDTRLVAKNVIYLCSESGLVNPFGNPLHILADREREVIYMAQQNSLEREEFLRTIKSMRRAMTLAREAARRTGSQPQGLLIRGDTLRCTSRDETSGASITPGRYYRVNEVVTPSIVHIYGDSGNMNAANISHFVLVESVVPQGGVVCAA